MSTIRCEATPPEMDLDAYVKEQRKALEDSVEDFSLLTENIKPDETVLMFVNRSGRKFYLTLQAGG